MKSLCGGAALAPEPMVAADALAFCQLHHSSCPSCVQLHHSSCSEAHARVSVRRVSLLAGTLEARRDVHWQSLVPHS